MQEEEDNIIKTDKELNTDLSEPEKNKENKPDVYEEIINLENNYISDPTQESCHALIAKYKSLVEYYSTQENYLAQRALMNQMHKILSSEAAFKLYSQKQKNNNNEKLNNPNKQKVNKILKITEYKKSLDKVYSSATQSLYEQVIKNYAERSTNLSKLLKQEISYQKNKFYDKIKFKSLTNVININNSEKQNKYKGKSRFSVYSRMNTSEFMKIGRSEGINSLRRRLSFHQPEKNNIKRSNSNSISDKKENTNNKNDTNELIDFLKEYNKKFNFLFQSKIRGSTEKLIKIINESYRKKLERQNEYENSISEFKLMMEAGDQELIESIKGIFDSSTNDYNDDLSKIENEEDKSIRKIMIKESKKNFHKNIELEKLNMEILGNLLSLFNYKWK